MLEKVHYLTPDGKRKLESELEHLRTVRRPQVAERIRQAKEGGDIMENASYDDAKNEQAFVEGRIMTLQAILRDAVVLTQPEESDTVQLGCHVTVRDGEGESYVYHIVGSAEADPQNGRISNESPVGRALLGRRVGEVVTVRAPGGSMRLTITDIA
ncbi:MAG: transcription elongation factor GreA [Anaerolineae bacterium]|nr:transcription elongation factor GreA [Anaerolineae bacterium]